MADQSTGNRPDGGMLGANPQILKTIGLIGAAIIIGIVLLNVVDDGKVTATKKPLTTTTTTARTPGATTTTSGDGATTTTASATAKVKPAQLKVIVLNGSGANGVARTLSTAIRAKGYTSQLPADTLATTRKGSVVQCRAGLETEAKTLATLMSTRSHVAKTETFPATLPKLKGKNAIPTTVQCLAIIGS